MLATFSRRERLEMIKHIKELQPLFSRFGAQAMSDVLSMELKGRKRRTVSAPVMPGKWKPADFTQARRTYQLVAVGESNFPDYRLPKLNFHEGVVSFDGLPELRVTFDPKAQTLKWTRPSMDIFEHGHILFNKWGLSGQGVVYLSRNEDEPEADGDISSNTIPFIVAKANSSVKKPSPRPNHDVFRRDSFSAASLPANRVLAAQGITADGDDYFNAQIDLDPWPTGTTKDSPTNPVDFGEVVVATFYTATSGMAIPIVDAPVLDQLCDLINKKYPRDDGTVLDSLYSTVVSQSAVNGNMVGTVTLTQAALLASLTDGASDTQLKTTGLTFKQSLGTDLVLPILFQSLEFEIDALWESFTGAAYLFDPSMRGSIGMRYITPDRPAPTLTLAQAPFCRHRP
jgi:hypothetical protein